MNYIVIDDKYTVLIGKNAKGNEEIIKMSHPESLWFHFKEFSGPHMILQTNGDLVSKKYIKSISKLLFTRKNVKDNIIYCKVEDVKPTNVLGQVVTKNTGIIMF